MQSTSHRCAKVKDGGSPQTRLKGNYPRERKPGGGREEDRRRLEEKACDAFNEGVNKYVSSGSTRLSVVRHGQKLIPRMCVRV